MQVTSNIFAVHMSEILYDSDKCIWKRDFGYDSLSMKEFDEYANIATTFIGHFIGENENISVEINRLKKKFRIIVRNNLTNEDEYDSAFSDIEAGYYKNGNVKWIDNFFGILNNEYGLAANDLEIPEFPSDRSDPYYEWWKLVRQFKNFKIDFEDGKRNDAYDKINTLRDKYFQWWIIPGFGGR